MSVLYSSLFKCPQGHHMKKLNKAPKEYSAPKFFCNICWVNWHDRDIKKIKSASYYADWNDSDNSHEIKNAYMHCSKCEYDICSKCCSDIQDDYMLKREKKAKKVKEVKKVIDVSSKFPYLQSVIDCCDGTESDLLKVAKVASDKIVKKID